jgi:hypothetical protein
MRTHSHDNEDVINGFRQEFTNTIEAIDSHLRARPFHLYAGFNSSAFDSVACAFAHHLDHIPDDISARYELLAASEEFEDLVRGGTTDVEQVRGRMAMAEEKLFG